jgi:hypothetical protein
MTTYNCKIGPIQLEHGYLTDSSDPGIGDGSEKFTVICSPAEAYQIRGLATPTLKNQYGNRSYINFEEPNWGLLPIDASVDLVDNTFITYRGIGYLLNKVTIVSESPFTTTLELEVEEILPNLLDYLRMDYTTGINDGTLQLTNYLPLAKTDRLNDTFSSLDTSTVWYPSVASTNFTGSFAASGGKLVASGVSGTTQVNAGEFIVNRTVFTPPFTVEATLEWTAQGSNTNHTFSLSLFPSKPVTWADYYTTNNLVRIVISVTPKTVYYYVQKYVGNKWTNVVKLPLTTAQKTPNFRITISSAKKLSVDVDKSGGTTWSNICSNVSISDVGNAPYNLVYGFVNNSTVSKTCNSASVEVYNYDAITPLNVVSLPVSTPITTPTFTRASEDGNINCYATPTGDLIYSTTIDNFYKGTVKGWNTNYADSVARLVTDKSPTLDPLKFYITNGLIKLTTTSTGVKLSYWNGSSYTDLNTFVIGTINRLKITECSPMRLTFLANSTEWTLEMGKPYCRVSHPLTALAYTVKTCYNHDGTISTSPGANADITMLSNSYCTAYNKGTGDCTTPNPTDNYRLLILKENMTAIKSDSIPADSLTALGMVNATENSSSYRDAISIAKEFMYKTRQSIATE